MQIGATSNNYPKEAKFNGRTHSRGDELKAYRKTIDTASKEMIKSMEARDYEAVDRWSRMIDDTQAKIHEIINQEDGHSSKEVEDYGKITKSTIDAVDGAVGSVERVVSMTDPIAKIAQLDIVA